MAMANREDPRMPDQTRSRRRRRRRLHVPPTAPRPLLVASLLALFLVAPSLRTEPKTRVRVGVGGPSTTSTCGASLVGASSSSSSDEAGAGAGDGDAPGDDRDAASLRRICDVFRRAGRTTADDEAAAVADGGMGAAVAVAPICLPRDAEAVRPLGAVVVPDMLDFSNERDSVDLYPSAFFVRPRLPSDGSRIPAIDCRGDGEGDGGEGGSERDDRREEEEMVVVRAPPIPSAAGGGTGNLTVTDLASLLRDASTAPRPDSSEAIDAAGDASRADGDDDGGATFEDHAARFCRCVEDAQSPSPSTAAHRPGAAAAAAEWSGGPGAERCLAHAVSAFDRAIAEYRSAANRGEINSILRRIVASEFGSPSALGGLLLAMGECDSDDSYDEFVSCTMDFGGEDRLDKNGKKVKGWGELQLDVNVHMRNVDEEGREWRCQTCGLHQHPRWYASRVVTGNVTYTLARPDCPTEDELDDASSLPTVEELDRVLANAGPAGTGLDVPGARYRMPGPGPDDGTTPGVTWETTEVVALRAGQTVLFPPNWYHRIVPPGPDATHSSVTLVAKFRPDRIVISDYDERAGGSSDARKRRGIGERDEQGRRAPYSLQPREIDADTTTKLACYGLVDVALALRRPQLDEARGLDVTPCRGGGELRDVYDVGRIGGIATEDEL